MFENNQYPYYAAQIPGEEMFFGDNREFAEFGFGGGRRECRDEFIRGFRQGFRQGYRQGQRDCLFRRTPFGQ